jgi:DNA repair protein RecO (recombination protein O)
MPSEERGEGIVVRSIDFKDRQKIITVFTQQHGLISLIVKGITRTRPHLLTLTSPFTQAEFLYSVGRSDLYLFRDGTPLTTHNSLRENLTHLTAGTQILQALTLSQLPGKAAPALYKLTLTYLKHLSSCQDPHPLTASFLLKLLKHEGHFSSDYREGYFSAKEWENIVELADVREMAKLKEMAITEELGKKLKEFFQRKVQR